MQVVSRRIQPLEAALTAHMLTGDAMLMIYGGGAISAWLGQRVPLELRDAALSTAEKLRFQNDLPKEARVEVVRQGLEGPVFRQHFPDWDAVQRAALAENKAAAAQGAGANAATAARRADVQAMAASGAALEAMPDDGSGVKKVWRIEKFEAVPLPEAEHGRFSTGDCYLVLYTFATEEPQHMLYMWQGRDSTQDEQGAVAVQAVKVDNEATGGKATQVRAISASVRMSRATWQHVFEVVGVEGHPRSS
jgi:gelsolin